MSSWKENIRAVSPYTPGEQPQGGSIIKLNTNENPYPPSPAVGEALRALNTDELRLYPDPEAGMLKEAIAKRCGVKPPQIFLGVGSDDVLSTIFLTCFNSGKPVLFPDVTYSFYPVWAGCYGVPYETIPLRDDWTVDPDDYRRENGGIVIANPNAPTGLEMPESGIRAILDANPDVIVVIDEAYVDFGAKSSIPLINEYDNLLVVQTLSKSRSLAGMRIGYAAACEELIKALSYVRYSINSYTINRPSIAAGKAAIEDEAYFEMTRREIMDVRDETKAVLEGLGFECLDTRTNFLFVTHPERSAKELYDALRDMGIYVRYFALPRIDDHLRITVGTRGQMRALTDALSHLLTTR